MLHRRSVLNALLIRLVCALALLLPVQQLAMAAHAFSHTPQTASAAYAGRTSASPTDTDTAQSVADSACGLCIGLAALGAAAVSQHDLPPLAPFGRLEAMAAAQRPVVRHFHRYRSRAPPLFLV